MARKKFDREDEVLMIGLCLMSNMFTTAMSTYNISYDKLDSILRELRYWDIFNDPEVTLAYAHDFVMDDFLNEIGAYV